MLGAIVAALVAASSAAAFTPANTYYGKQWYLGQDNAFDAWASPPMLDPVKIAVVDSGVDCGLPDFKGQIADEKSFVGGSRLHGHAGARHDRRRRDRRRAGLCRRRRPCLRSASYS